MSLAAAALRAAAMRSVMPLWGGALQVPLFYGWGTIVGGASISAYHSRRRLRQVEAR